MENARGTPLRSVQVLCKRARCLYHAPTCAANCVCKVSLQDTELGARPVKHKAVCLRLNLRMPVDTPHKSYINTIHVNAAHSAHNDRDRG